MLILFTDTNSGLKLHFVVISFCQSQPQYSRQNVYCMAFTARYFPQFTNEFLRLFYDFIIFCLLKKTQEEHNTSVLMT